jgi:hypothetical protein
VPHVGAAVVVLQSEKPDTVVEGLYRQLRDSARRQFSGHRPAVLCVRLRDLSAPQLIALASERVNGLATVTTRLFAADDRAHLAGIKLFISLRGTHPISRKLNPGRWDGLLLSESQEPIRRGGTDLHSLTRWEDGVVLSIS